MSEEKVEHKTKDDRLPVEKRAELLSGESSLYFNVAKFEHAQRIASLFSSSTMVPDHFQGNVANCLIALNYADRLKADPFMVMQNMYIVHGRPGVEAKLVIALINQSGKYSEPLKFRFDGSGDDYGCTAWTRESKSGEVVEGPKVTWKMVKAEGWDKDKTNKKTGYTQASKWKTMPEMMFRYRAASYFANVHCPELKLGMQTVEEINDYVELRQSENGKWQPASEEKPELDHEVFGGILDDPLLEKFIAVTAEKNHSTRDEVVLAANAHSDKFSRAFAGWKQALDRPEKPDQDKPDRDAQTSRKPDHAAEQKAPRRRGQNPKAEPKAAAANTGSAPSASRPQDAANGTPIGPDFEDDPREVGYPSAEALHKFANSPDIKSVHPAGTAAGQSSLFTQSERDKLIAEIKRYPAEAVAKARAAILPVDRV